MEKEFYITKEQFIALKDAWKQKQSHSASEIIIYNILRSKPADNGFCLKTKNIQGNDEWYGFNQAIFNAKSKCACRNYVREPGAQFGKWVDDMETTQKRFKKAFGIDMPEDILAKIAEAKK